MLTLLLSLAFAHADTLAAGDTAWTTAEVALQRWTDDEVTVATLDPDTKVELVIAQGDLWRVRKGSDFGWVSAAMLTETMPAGTEDKPIFDISDMEVEIGGE